MHRTGSYASAFEDIATSIGKGVQSVGTALFPKKTFQRLSLRRCSHRAINRKSMKARLALVNASLQRRNASAEPQVWTPIVTPVKKVASRAWQTPQNKPNSRNHGSPALLPPHPQTPARQQSQQSEEPKRTGDRPTQPHMQKTRTPLQPIHLHQALDSTSPNCRRRGLKRNISAPKLRKLDKNRIAAAAKIMRKRKAIPANTRYNLRKRTRAPGSQTRTLIL